jgi:hypothetical protein
MNSGLSASDSKRGNPIIGAVIGAFIGYLIYKKSRFSKINYYDPFA